MCENVFQIYSVHIPGKCIKCKHFYSYPLPLKTSPKFLSSHLGRGKLLIPLGSVFCENLFPLYRVQKLYKLHLK